MNLLLAILIAFSNMSASIPVKDLKHVVVYEKEGRYGGWPANHGIWIWGDEILVGFTEGHYKDLGPDRHHIDRETPELHYLARSKDGGETWAIIDPGLQGDLITEGGYMHGVPREDTAIPPLMDCPGGIPFTHPDFALAARMDNIGNGSSRFWYSLDRGNDWSGPYRLPNFDFYSTAARTDYQVEGPSMLTLFSSAAEDDSNEGRPFCMRTRDGGKTWELVSKIGPDPRGFSIMPASVKLDQDTYYVAVRRREGEHRWIAAFRSDDNGESWQEMPDPVDECGDGNPPSLIRLKDGRLCLTYGYRSEPFSICARLSGDEGRTWGPIRTLRTDGAGQDMGYCRSVQRNDGRVVTLYYFTHPVTGPERSIVATIWKPDQLTIDD